MSLSTYKPGAAFALLCALTSAACSRDDRPPPQLPADFTWLTTSNDPLQWQRAGYIEVVTPARPPTSEDTKAHIVVVVRIPDGQHIVDGKWPIGSTAARVEYSGQANAPDAPVAAAWRVLDVRSFTWTAQGRQCAVLRPNRDGQLVGLRWPCSIDNDQRASELLRQFVLEQRFASPSGPAARQRAADHLASINRCIGCHQPNRTEDRSPNTLVQRGTDAEGLFSIRSAFRDEDPIERYRPVDTNRSDANVALVCPGSELDQAAALCRDGQRPRLRYNLAAARYANAPHAAQLCNTRGRLAPFFDDATRATLQPALAACAALP
jgi:hypothetical protein